MIEVYYVGAYWGVRRELVDECAQRAANTLSCLARGDIGLGGWYKTARSRRSSLKHEVTPDIAILRSLLLSGRVRSDFSRQTLDELGFSLDIWSPGARDAESAALTLRCGSFAPAPGVNSCVLTLPYEGPIAERILRVPVLTAVMECIVSAWEPDWGVVTSQLYQRMATTDAGNAPRTRSGRASRGQWIPNLNDRRAVHGH